MLKSLYIKNFILIDEEEISFSENFNVIIGETGSGKSIVLEAINVLIGERAKLDYIRNGQKKAIVEGFFQGDIHSNLTEEYMLDNEFTIRREINSNGNSRAFLNDTPISINKLKLFTKGLIDLVSQGENFQLKNSKYQLNLYDKFIKLNTNFIADYKKYVKLLDEKLNERDKFINKISEVQQRKDFLLFQLEEFEKISPKENEIEELDVRIREIESKEENLNKIYNYLSILDSHDSSIIQSLSNLNMGLIELSKFIPNLENYSKEIESSLESLKNLQNELILYSGTYEKVDENISLDALRERYQQLRKLEKKYLTFENAVLKYKTAKNELESLENFDYKLDELNKNIISIRKEIGNIGEKINIIRKEGTNLLQNELISVLNNLNFDSPIIKIEIENIKDETERTAIINNDTYKLFEFGIDKFNIYVSFNKGQETKLLKDVASGGEISRFLLAFKSLISSHIENQSLILDEIDSGLSGKVARATGIIMKNISTYQQVIVVTHSAQIASLGMKIFKIEKNISENRTTSKVRELNNKEIEEEIAKLISGDKITENTISSARELIFQK